MVKNPSDPFRKAREESGVFECEFQGEKLPMILRHEDVRRAAKDWETFSSDAPFRVPIPSEEDCANDAPIAGETNPPDHTDYRAIVEPFFRRAKDPAVISRIEALGDELLSDALQRDSIEVVRDFALPFQSRALAYLLNVPETEAATWISWGTHVFRDWWRRTKKRAQRSRPISMRSSTAQPPILVQTFFSALTQATFSWRPLSREEMMGFANLTFAGGRDTIIPHYLVRARLLGPFTPTRSSFSVPIRSALSTPARSSFASSPRSRTSAAYARWKPMCTA
jgi:cytochrome P450